MTDPPRLLDEGTPEEIGLLRAATQEEPPAPWKQEARVALGLGSGLAVGTLSVFSTAKGTWPVASRWLIAGLTATIAAGSIAYWALRHVASGNGVVAQNDPNAIVAQAPLPVEPAKSEGSDPEQPAAEPVTPTIETPSEAPRRAPSKTNAAAIDSRASSLGEQVARLDEVRVLLAKHDAQAAKARLDAFAKDFPRPALGPEAKVLEVQTLLDLGDPKRAAAVARDFLRAHPGSAHARQLEALVAAQPPTN
jgi:hypothetical protein